jgi:hypothetical protein
VLCTDGPVTSLVELTLAAEHRRGHGRCTTRSTTAEPAGLWASLRQRSMRYYAAAGVASQARGCWPCTQAPVGGTTGVDRSITASTRLRRGCSACRSRCPAGS